MNYLKTFVCALALMAASVAQGAQPKPQSFFDGRKSPEKQQLSAARLQYIDRLLQAQVDSGVLPHALTFVARNGVVVHSKAFGWRNVESRTPLTTTDIFREYSQTKAITTVALMRLFEQGKFQLDDPVSRYIPECTDQVFTGWKSDGSYTSRKVASPLTIRHLLCHASGILGSTDLQALRRQQMDKRNGKPYETLREEVLDLIRLPLAFDPGTQWNYHPASDVWGYLVEYFSGKSLRDYVTETIFRPLGMTETDWYFADTSLRQRFVTAYNSEKGHLVAQRNVWSGRNPFSTDTRYCQSGTGLSGTIGDYARFCQMILNGGTFNGQRILGRRTIEMMSRNQLPLPNRGGADFNFGIGFQIYPADDTQRKAISNFTPMVSPGSLSWGGMYNTDYLIDPQENLVIILYTNRRPDIKIWERFLNTVYQALE